MNVEPIEMRRHMIALVAVTGGRLDHGEAAAALDAAVHRGEDPAAAAERMEAEWRELLGEEAA